jgi:cytochrome o ubiquinol oxidase subunit IV
MKFTFKSYIIGFASSLALTLAAAWFVWVHVNSGHVVFSHQFLYAAVLALAVIQLFVQLICFMHLAGETGPRWRTGALISTAGIIVIIVAGAIWIMNHLNYNMMASPTQMETYIQSQDGF